MTYAEADISVNGVRSPVLQTSAASSGWTAAWRSGMPSTLRRLTDVRQPNLSHARPQASHPYETGVAFAKPPHVIQLAGIGSRIWRDAGLAG